MTRGQVANYGIMDQIAVLQWVQVSRMLESHYLKKPGCFDQLIDKQPNFLEFMTLIFFEKIENRRMLLNLEETQLRYIFESKTLPKKFEISKCKTNVKYFLLLTGYIVRAWNRSSLY